MLNIKNLNVKIDNKQIIKDLNLDINDGEIHVLMGPNGAGKSTISQAIFNNPLYQISGSIKYNEKELIGLEPNAVANQNIFLLNQNPMEIEGITNAELLRTILSDRYDKPVDIFKFNKKLESICQKLAIDRSFIHRKINLGMSGGEKKKNELLHMWMLEPKFIILDEIDSGLDVDALKLVTKSINEYYEEFKPSILIITHQIKLLDYIKPNYVHVLLDGKIAANGDILLAKDIEKNGFNKYKSANIVSEENASE